MTCRLQVLKLYLLLYFVFSFVINSTCTWNWNGNLKSLSPPTIFLFFLIQVLSSPWRAVNLFTCDWILNLVGLHCMKCINTNKFLMMNVSPGFGVLYYANLFKYVRFHSYQRSWACVVYLRWDIIIFGLLDQGQIYIMHYKNA